VFGILDGIIKERLQRMDSGGAGEAGEDLLDVLLKIHKDGSLQIPLDMDVLKAVIFVSSLCLLILLMVCYFNHRV